MTGYDIWFCSSDNCNTNLYFEVTCDASLKNAFYLKDHLGNIRVTIADDGTVISADDYYPFGMTMPGRSYNQGFDRNIYKYSSKELDEEQFTGAMLQTKPLDWYYFGARYYDPEIARWMAVDPLADKYPSLNSYNYCGDNPIRYYDLDGNAFYDTKGNRISSKEAYRRVKELIGNALSNIFEGTSKNTTLDFYSKENRFLDLFDGDYSYSWNDAVTKIGRLGCFETQQSITLNTESVITNKIDQQTILNYEFKSYNTDLSGNPLYEFRLVNANKGGDFLIKIVGRSMEELNSILSNWGYEFVRTKDKEGNDKWKMQKVTEEEKNRYERLIKKLKENQDYRPRINADGTISD